MKVALYARVSTSDKDQDPETQLMPLRDFIEAQGWTARLRSRTTARAEEPDQDA